MNIQQHGGQDNNIKIKFKEDFSVTTNLLGSNKNALEIIKKNLKEIEHYPPQSFEPYLSNLKDFLFKDLEENNNILLGNGASELIDLVIRSVPGDSWKPGKSSVQFLEYERCAISANKEKKKYDDNGANLMCIINTNNPTGDYMNIEKMKDYITKYSVKHSYVIVDESMQPWVGSEWRKDSLLSQTKWIKEMAEKYIYIYIIHSWTKIFSCTGIRYGSLICPTNNLYIKIKSIQVPWSVNILALKYVDYCIKDDEYLENTWKKTIELRKYQIKKIKDLFPTWECIGKPFLSWIWINTHDKTVAKLAYQLAKYNGTPIRYGKIGYKMSTHIRIAVREKKYFDDLLECISILKNPIHKSLIHVNIDDSIIIDFKWIELNKLKSHEAYIEKRHTKLLEYIKSIGNPFSIPALIVCSKTLTIIDGHHRYSVMRVLGVKKVPCLLIHYENKNIIVSSYNSITKKQVIDAGITSKYLAPKSTAHMIMDKNSNFHPIIILSPIVFVNMHDNNKI